MGIEAGHASDRRNCNSDKCRQRFSAEAGESEIEPDHVRLAAADLANQSPGVGETVKCPAAHHLVAVEFRLWGIEVVPKNSELESFRVLQLARDVKSVFIKRFAAGRESGYQANLHYCCPALNSA